MTFPLDLIPFFKFLVMPDSSKLIELFQLQWHTLSLTTSFLVFFYYCHRILRYLRKPTVHELKYTKIKVKGRKEGQNLNDIVQGWIPIWPSFELKRGEINHGILYDKDFVILRKEDGVAVVMDAHCPHLGAHLGYDGRLVQVKKGESNQTCIECPFHAWKFDCDKGKLVKDQDSQKSLPDNLGIPIWKTCEVNGMIYTWYHSEEATPTWELKAHDDINTGKMKYRGHIDLQLHCYKNEVPENGADFSHFEVLHSLLFDFTGRWKFLNFLNRIIVHKYVKKSFVAYDDHTAKSSFEIVTYIFEKEVDKFNMYFYYEGPSVIHVHVDGTMGDFHSITNVSTIPTGKLKQRSMFILFTPRGFRARIISKLILFSTREMLKKDSIIWNSKLYFRNPIITKDERPIREFRKWFSKFVFKNE